MTSPVLWTAKEILAAIEYDRVTTESSWSASGVSIDTRTLEEGDVFFALSGPNHDAHEFVAAAFQKGAVAAIVTRDPGNCPQGAPLIIVGDVTAALQQLGKAARDRLKGKIIAVTGSVGKTGTKEMLRIACESLGRTEASAGNLNNHWGLPLSLCRMPPDTAYTIVELGMNHPGEIRVLTGIARPHVAIVTAIEPAHTEYFTSVDEIAAAKAEIFEGVEPDGTAIINQDSPYFDFLSSAARKCGISSVVGFGRRGEADVQLRDVNLNANDSDVEAVVQGAAVRYRIGAPGLHVVTNSLSVLAAINAIGGDVARAARKLDKFKPLKGRGQHVSVQSEAGSFLVIDESYNASPASMKAAMAVAGKNRPDHAGRRIAVLGDMLELGAGTKDAHRDLLSSLRDNRFDTVFTSGQHMQSLWEVLPAEMRGGHSVSPHKLAMLLTSAVQDGDVILVKGSLGSRVGVIVEALLGLDQSSLQDHQKVVNGS